MRDGKQLMDDAVRADVRAYVKHVREDSGILTRLIADYGLFVVGANTVTTVARSRSSTTSAVRAHEG